MKKQTLSPRVAIVADWLVSLGGAERVLEALAELYPKAPIYTPLYNKQLFPQYEKRVRTSYLQRIPFALKHHRLLVPCMPRAVESWDFSKFDIVISSSSSGMSKGIITGISTHHICYCHTPPRYLWDNANAYIGLHRPGLFSRLLLPGQLMRLRLWDTLASQRVDTFIANARIVSDRIQKYYRRESTVIYPPVDCSAYLHSTAKKKDYFLAVGRLIPYKRFDLVIGAANALKVPLRIVGTGPEKKRLQKMAGPTVTFLEHISDDQLASMYAQCTALVFPQVEDFGLTAVEVQAAGRPVVAFQKGGALETVIPNRTGVFFNEPTIAALAAAMKKVQTLRTTKAVMQKNARRFDKLKFQKEMHKVVLSRYASLTH